MTAARRSFLPIWGRRSRIASLISRAERVKLSDIFSRKSEQQLISGEKRIRPVLAKAEVETFHRLWDAMVVKKLDIEKAGHVKTFQDWMLRIVHSKYPPLTAAMLESDFQGATVRNVFDLYWDASLGDPESDRVLMSVLDMTPIEIRQSLRRHGQRLAVFGAVTSASAVLGGTVASLVGNNVASWAKTSIDEGWYSIADRWKMRKRREILDRISRITQKLRQPEFENATDPQEAKSLWAGPDGYFEQYARLFREWNSLTPVPTGQDPARAAAEREKVRHGAWSNLTLAMSQYQAAQLALANPAAPENKVHDPEALKAALDKSVHELARDLANWEFVLISQSSSKEDKGGASADNPTDIAQMENEANTDSTTESIFDDLVKIRRYLTRPDQSPFQDFTNFFIREVSNLNSRKAGSR